MKAVGPLGIIQYYLWEADFTEQGNSVVITCMLTTFTLGTWNRALKLVLLKF